MNCHHNFSAKERHWDKDAWISSKGALAARAVRLALLRPYAGEHAHRHMDPAFGSRKLLVVCAQRMTHVRGSRDERAHEGVEGVFLRYETVPHASPLDRSQCPLDLGEESISLLGA